MSVPFSEGQILVRRVKFQGEAELETVLIHYNVVLLSQWQSVDVDIGCIEARSEGIISLEPCFNEKKEMMFFGANVMINRQILITTKLISGQSKPNVRYNCSPCPISLYFAVFPPNVLQQRLSLPLHLVLVL